MSVLSAEPEERNNGHR